MSAKRFAKIEKGLTFSKASYWVGTGSGAQPEPENWPDESASASESMASAMSSGMAMGSIMGAMVGADEGPLAYATGQEQMHCSRTDSRSMSCSKSEGDMCSSKKQSRQQLQRLVAANRISCMHGQHMHGMQNPSR